MTAEQDTGLSIKEAAELLQVHEKTVRHRLRTGELHGAKMPRPQGYEWRVYLDDSPPAQVSAQVNAPPAHVDSPDLVRLVEKLHAENTQLAGQLGFVQAKLQEAEKTIALLMAPKDEPAPADAPAAPPARPWWKVWGR